MHSITAKSIQTFHPESKATSAADRSFFDALAKSKIYRDYQEAFQKASGLPLSLRPPDSHGASEHSAEVGAFCGFMAETYPACAECVALRQQLEREARLEPKTLKCFAGLCESAAPVRVGDQLIAFLHTGHVLLHEPTAAGFSRIAKTLLQWGSQADLKRLEEAYYHTRVLSPAQYESFVRLLAVFAEHLAACSGQLALDAGEAEVPAIEKARSLIAANHRQELSLKAMADSVNLSAGYFSELFRKSTGLTFVEYLTRVRVEQAKCLLQDTRLKISDVAFRIGFGSISQFNRAFKKSVGQTPRQFRTKRPLAQPSGPSSSH